MAPKKGLKNSLWLYTATGYGIDQGSLALMFGKGTKQQQISHYLNQIRTAIYKVFVPNFLGATKPRDFYLKFNTVMTHRIFDLNEND